MQVDAQVLEGILQHKNVHAQTSTKQRITAIPVCSEQLGLIGVIDAIEAKPDGLTILEHKRGSSRQWDNDQLQVVAQAIAYEETAGTAVQFGSVFSWQTRRRYEFAITPELRIKVAQTVQQMRDLLQANQRPAPTSDVHKCKLCSVRETCQPTLIQRLNKTRKEKQ